MLLSLYFVKLLKIINLWEDDFMRKIGILLLALVLCMGMFTGCAKGESPAATTAAPTATIAADLTGWAYIQDKGELIVGLDDTFAPMGFRDDAGNLVGFDIDLAKAVGTKLGIKITFQPIDWDSKELELSSKRIDCIWNGMSANAERQASMALTKKYLNNRIVIMTKTGGEAVTAKADLKDLKIGTQAGSSALDAIKADSDYAAFSANISEYPTYDEVLLDMQAGRIDCMVVDEVLGEYKNSKLTEKLIVSEINFGDDFYAIGCRKGETDLADKLNDTIEALINDGTASDISNTWFGKNIVILEDYS